MSDLNGKTAIVTGANSGMGFATVEALSDMGATVLMLCRNEKRGRDAIDSLTAEKERKHAKPCPPAGEMAFAFFIIKRSDMHGFGKNDPQSGGTRLPGFSFRRRRGRGGSYLRRAQREDHRRRRQQDRGGAGAL